MSIIGEFTTVIGEWLTAMLDWIGQVFTGVIDLFYDSTDGLTILGVLMLFGLAVGLVYFGINFVRRLIQK